MPHSRGVVVFVALVAWCHIGSSAMAQSKTSKQRKTMAQAHYKRAIAYENLDEWNKAVFEYSKAHELYPDPEFFYLIAEVYVRAGDDERALEYYGKYLRDDPTGRMVDEARPKMENLRAKVRAARAKKRKEAANKHHDRATKNKPRKQPTKNEVRKRPTNNKVRKRPTNKESSTSTSRPGRSQRIAGLAVGIGSIVALGLGLKFGLDAKSAQNDVNREWNQDRFDEGKTAERNMFIFSGVGAAALIAGGVVYYLGVKAGRRGANESRVSVVPRVGPSGAGIQMHLRF